MTSVRKRQMRLFLICLFFILPNFLFGQTADEILNRYFTSTSNGDLSQWSKIKTLYATSVDYFSEINLTPQRSTFDSANLSYTKIYKRWPDEQKEELFSDSLYKNRTSQVFFLKNKRVIMLDYMDPIEASPNENSTFDFYQNRIKNYMRQSKEIKYNGIKVLPDKLTSCYEIEIKTRDFDHIYLFNVETYLLEAVYFPVPNIYWILSEYKSFDGYLIPTFIGSMKDGVFFSWRRYKTFKFNLEFHDNMFNPDR